jgi:hypothetical protein
MCCWHTVSAAKAPEISTGPPPTGDAQKAVWLAVLVPKSIFVFPIDQDFDSD